MASGYNHPNVKWYGPKVNLKMLGKIARNLKEAGNLLQAELKRTLSKSGRAFVTVDLGGGKFRRRYFNTRTASLPGEPPRKQTGALGRSIFRKYYRKQKKVRVGTKILGILNTGTKRIKPRPYIIPTVNKIAQQLLAILTRPIL